MALEQEALAALAAFSQQNYLEENPPSEENQNPPGGSPLDLEKNIPADSVEDEAKQQELDLVELIRHLVAEEKSLPPESITAEYSFQPPALDQLSQYAIIAQVEADMNLTLPDETIATCKTITELAQAFVALKALVSAEKPGKSSK